MRDSIVPASARGGAIMRPSFAGVRLGQVLALDGGGGAVVDAALRAVKAWSGSPSVQLVSVRGERTANTDGYLQGRVLARHLDGSGTVDIEVSARGSDSPRVVVRAMLA